MSKTSDLSDQISGWVKAQSKPENRPLILMLSGAQGIGKSTALNNLSEQDKSLCVLGLDDFYLSKADRTHLARTVHPLFETRGPPGTHDLSLLNSTLDRLLCAWNDEIVPIPVFSKKLDDRLPEHKWRTWKGRPEVIILEGWMVGALPDANAPFAPPLNEIEACDMGGKWRGYQEAGLSAAYAELWDRADAFCHVHAPSFEYVLGWRVQQEAGNLGIGLSELPINRIKWVDRFIQHYERITRRMLNGLHRPGLVINVDELRVVRA